MSEETRRKAAHLMDHNWTDSRIPDCGEEIVDAITAHMRDELHAEFRATLERRLGCEQPTPAKCEECGGDLDGLCVVCRRPMRRCREESRPKCFGASTVPCPKCSKPAQPSPTTHVTVGGFSADGIPEPPRDVPVSPTTEAPETIRVYRWQNMGLWVEPGNTMGAVTTEYTRSDVVEKRVAEAVKKDRLEWEHESRTASRFELNAAPNETLPDAARRVVAALEASVASEAALLEGVRKAEASEQAALAKVRELQSELATESNRFAEMMQAKLDQQERAETAERELTISKADYRKACDELRSQQDKTVAAERELGEARAATKEAVRAACYRIKDRMRKDAGDTKRESGGPYPPSMRGDYAACEGWHAAKTVQAMTIEGYANGIDPEQEALRALDEPAQKREE